MSDLRTLIEAAKKDAPSAAARAKVWTGVSGAVGAAPSSVALGGSAGAAKMLALGTLLGGTLTIGIGAAVLFLGNAQPKLRDAGTIAAQAEGPASAFPSLRAPPLRAAFVTSFGTAATTAAPGAAAAPATDGTALPKLPEAPAIGHGSNPVATLNAAPRRDAPPAAPSADVEATRRRSSLRTVPNAQDDALAREASLLAGARSALVRHDPLSALQIVRGLRDLPVRQLRPEELAVEAQALHGLGLDEEAEALEATLRSSFPDSALGR